ncbi:MAG: hypothetical protein EOS05_24455 [Mesorhizobium sp.]|nr:MAG: hypothetical protein EOS05_24455 [Mesorhizobium sp.]
MIGCRRPSSACRHLLPVNGEKTASRNRGALSATLEIGETADNSVLLPVTIRGEVPGRAMRGSVDIRKAKLQ